MGKRTQEVREVTRRRIRSTPITPELRALLQSARYEGNPQHKRNPGDFGLTPPSAPRQDKTLCDEAGVTSRAVATEYFDEAIRRGLVSQATTHAGFPKQIWLVSGNRVFEAMQGGSRDGCYHGYPLRDRDPLADQIRKAWGKSE